MITPTSSSKLDLVSCLISYKIANQDVKETFAEGKRADFFYAKCQNSDAKKKNPARAKLIVPYGARRYRGQVSTLKPGYGFIKRLR